MNYQFFFFVSIFSSIILGWSYMMIRVTVGLFPILTRHSTNITILGLIGVGAFIVGMMGSNSVPNPIFSTLYKYGAIWIGGLTITGFIGVIFLIFSGLSGIIYSHIGHLLTFIILAIGLNGWSLYASFVPRIQEYTIEIAKPHTWHGKKIIMIADTHYGNIYDTNDAKKLAQTINALSGEIVIIPGDFFDGPAIDFENVAREFDAITAPGGILFANGNHEEYRNTDSMMRALEKSKITIINNTKTEVNGMIFAGVTYHTTESSGGLIQTLDSLGLESNKPTILLKHKPTLHDTLQKYPIDLVVSGHTHRGQLWPFTYIPDLIYGKYVYGYNQDASLQSITTSGVGSWGPPQRLGTRSEIVVINIK